MAGRSTTDAIFIVHQLQEKYLAKNKEIWMAFVDLEKAFDMDMDATTKVRLNGRESNAFSVRVGVHQGSVLSPLLFMIVLEALSRSSGKVCYGIPLCR